MILLPLALLVIFRTSFFRYFIYRMTETSSTEGRFGGYEGIALFFTGKPAMLMFGYGLGGVAQADYLPGFGKLLLGFGLIGCIVFGFTMILVYQKARTWQKTLIIIFLVLQTGTEIMFGNSIMCYYPFMLSAVPIEENNHLEKIYRKGFFSL